MWALVANRFATNKEKGELVFLFRESPQKFNMNSLKTKISIKLYENSFLKGSLRCSTDSLRLAKDYAKVLAVPLDIYPIPYITKTTSILKHFFNEQSVINCLILDNTNSDKNFSIIYQLIKEINSNIDTIKKFNFSLQAYNMNDDASLTHLNNMTFPNVSFYERTLSSEKYYQLIDEADVIFVPHQDHSDSSCTSRRALEAIANGKIIISHQNCWLADECIRFGAAAELVPDGDIQAVINALLKILSKINSLKSQAVSASIKIRENHNCEVFVKKLLYGPIKHSIKIGDIITISYPFSNLINGKSGNSTRVNYLMRLLKDYKLSILAPDQVISSNPMEKPPFKLYNYSENKIYLFDLWYIFLEKFFKFFGDKKDLYLLNIFNRHTWNRNFSLALTQALHGSSAIFVEYPFQTKLISIYAKAMRIPLIVTAHDQLSLIVKNKLRRNYIDKKEIESLSCADLAFTVSQNEHEYFKNIGINNILAPSTTDIHYFNFSKESKYRSIELIRTNFGCDFKVFFLFVGGNQEPNREASIYLRKIARQAHENNLKWNFVVAGSCAEPKDSTDNYIALGQVDDTMLKSLYETCYAIVSPLLSGTGASVKTVEAMGAGKIILGTQKTFRGLSVTDGVECFIENDVSNYINRLKHIVVSSDQKIVLQSMSKKAKQFAEKYDYHICLKDYKLFIQNWPLE
jgi:glycosyltransferase involved in cell wall biosynthesis